jgi:hypothetical protein
VGGGIFLIQGDEQLVEMTEQPYDSEDLLQALLAKYPSLLAGDQMGAAPRRWLLVGREASLPSEEDGAGRWSVDHLFLDQEAVPTLVEVKRSSDTRIRREVVGQMLDYAANAVVYWPVERLRATFEVNCESQGVDPDGLVSELVGDDHDPEQFWEQAATNLHAGRVRLVFVADDIPRELQRVVEFLNTQMNPAEVLAIEVKQYVGEGLRTLVPKVLGQTAEAEQRKRPGGRQYRQWDEESFLQALAEERGDAERAVASKVIGWTTERGLRSDYGRGKFYGSFFPVVDHGGDWYSPVALWTNGRVEVQFGLLSRRPTFDAEAKREELAQRLNAIEGVEIPLDAITRSPSFPLATLARDAALAPFLDVLDWFVAEVRSTESDEYRSDPSRADH